MIPFRLEQSDKVSPTWMKLRQHFEEELATLRKMNDGKLDEVATARLRGRIREVKYVLSLGEDQVLLEQ